MDHIKLDTSHLHQVALSYPAIDNHTHPLLKEAFRDDLPFEGLISEADGDALIKDAPTTLACLRAAGQLGQFFGLPKGAGWEDVKSTRRMQNYLDLCKRCMKPTGIHCVLLDDGLGYKERVEDVQWHDQFFDLPSKRIVRIETEAEYLLRDLFSPHLEPNAKPFTGESVQECLDKFTSRFQDHLTRLVRSEEERVVGFKSVICYRTGLDVSLSTSADALNQALADTFGQYSQTQRLRLQNKPLNDYVLKVVLDLCSKTGKPIQFHTGLGDNDLTLTLANPAHMQPLVKAYPEVKFVLLHTSYPYTREAGYLTAVYPNVYFDFGEVFPFLSGSGQRDTLRQVLELSPTNKILFSTDGHYWPESYYLGTIQARNALYEVLREALHHGELTEAQAIDIVKAALFKNANRLYELGFADPE